MNLRSVNLNLLPILQAFLRERSVSKAAVALRLSPSAASEALGRLRSLLGDSLLVQVGRSMALTPFAVQLIEPVEQLCADLEIVLRRRVFEPSTAQRVFRICAVDYQAYQAAVRTADALSRQAPGVKAYYFDPTAETVNQLKSGYLDFMIGVHTFAPDLYFESLWVEQLVGVFANSHPLSAKATLTDQDLRDYPSVEFNAAQQSHFPDPSPLPPRSAATVEVQQLLSLPLLALMTQHFAIVPRTLTKELAAFLPLQVREMPGPALTLDIGLMWGQVQHKDPAHGWFRQLLVDALGSLS